MFGLLLSQQPILTDRRRRDMGTVTIQISNSFGMDEAIFHPFLWPNFPSEGSHLSVGNRCESRMTAQSYVIKWMVTDVLMSMSHSRK